ncbi:glycosyltransferase family 2 protein, partial [candidate division WWE3 bacterium]|nr:glycosyltransferase family 2 protein [candidate division WWE3 bacterium]
TEHMEDHVDEFFANQVLRELADDLTLISKALQMSIDEKEKLSNERVTQLYQRLVWTFQAEFGTFERKKYLSLSHEPNKAMNLNAYISLMGNTYKQVEIDDGILLEPTDEKNPDNFVVADSEYLLTLDADSILLREYCLRLVYLLEQPENEQVAVTQTPYSSFRGAYSRIERLAGATTDIQHVLHQGMTHYGATFWVGANAIIRKKALEDIVETEWENGITVKRYIQDHTVIEDTESSIDLTKHGWYLVNYPERLSYSATPPDFGALVIQRRRWANGGLLIMSKLWSVIRQRKNKNELISRTEILLRVNYLISIAWATFGLMFLLAYPYDGRLLSPLVLLSAMPYFITMASDLKYNGYNALDIFSIYGFNLILLPVNFAGVMKSIEQAITGKKIPFGRTPKVKNRTSASLFFVVVPVLIVAFSVFTVWRNVLIQNWGNATFAAFNAILATWAIIAYIGIGNLLTDLWLGLTDWLYVESKPKNIAKNTNAPEKRVDWKKIIHQGDIEGIKPRLFIDELA